MSEIEPAILETAEAFERVGLAALWCRRDASIVGLTSAAASLLGYPSVEKALEVVRVADSAWCGSDEIVGWLQQVNNGQHGALASTMLGADGSPVPVELHLPANAEGPEETILVIALDAGPTEIESGRRALIARFESIGASCGAIGHKLNNLLAGMLGYSTLLRRAVPAEATTAKRYLDSLDEATQRLNDLTKQLLIIAQKNINYRVAPLEVRELMRAVSDLARGKRPELPLTFAEPESGLQVDADRDALVEAVGQLVFGAASVLPSVEEVDIAVTSEEVDGRSAISYRIAKGRYAVIRIDHHHSSVDGAVRERMFDPYYSYDGKGKGAELLLGKAWGVIALHKGTLTVMPTDSGGTRIIVFLPEHAG